MTKLEDECVSCDLPCLGTHCPIRNVPHYYCDKCGEEYLPNGLYKYDDKDLCKDCLLEEFETLG